MPRCMSVVLRFSDFRSDKRGVVAVMLALALLPMLICVGLAIDYGRMVLYQADLQYAADEAALAGAASFFDASETMDAQDIATNFFYSQFNDLPPERLINLTMTLDPDATITTTHGPSSARTVTVTADTTIAATFLAILGAPSLAISATGTAAVQSGAARLIQTP